jgi:hypothetical protein
MDGAPCILLVVVGRPSFDGTVAYARGFRVLFFLRAERVSSHNRCD